MNASLTSAKPRRKMGTGAKVALGTLATLTLLMAGLADTISRRNELPNITIPVSPEPNPNARNFFLAATGAMQDTKSIDDAVSKPPTSKVAKSTAHEASHVYTLAEKAKIVRENQNALVTLRQGFAYSYGSPPARSFSAIFPEFAKFRQMARLLTLEGQVKEAQGDWNGAVSSELDAIEMGVMLPRNGVLIADLVGIACEAIGRRRLWDDYSRLNAAQTVAALRRLEKIEAKRFSFADVIEEEKRIGQAGMLEAFQNPEKFAGEADATDTEGNQKESGLQKLAWQMRVKWAGRRAIFENYTRYMNQFTQNSRQSYGLHLPPPLVPNDPINQIMLPVLNQVRIKQVSAETENRLLAVSLALHVYREAHGVYPQSLDAVWANVPPSLRNDPFAAQGDLRYRRDGAKYVLYSVGPDGRDDGGKPIYDKTKAVSDSSERARYFTQQDSVGDVVAGANQ